MKEPYGLNQPFLIFNFTVRPLATYLWTSTSVQQRGKSQAERKRSLELFIMGDRKRFSEKVS